VKVARKLKSDERKLRESGQETSRDNFLVISMLALCPFHFHHSSVALTDVSIFKFQMLLLLHFILLEAAGYF
jgi:hypothetical protein